VNGQHAALLPVTVWRRDELGILQYRNDNFSNSEELLSSICCDTLLGFIQFCSVVEVLWKFVGGGLLWSFGHGVKRSREVVQGPAPGFNIK